MNRKHELKVFSNVANRDSDLLLSFVWFYSLDGEEWREIEGMDSRYFVSNKGRVLSLCNDGYKLLKPFVCDGDYLYVDLRKDKKDHKSRVHRLVANAFFGEPPQGGQCHHKDHNRQNNELDNLEWLTPAEHAEQHRTAPKVA